MSHISLVLAITGVLSGIISMSILMMVLKRYSRDHTVTPTAEETPTSPFVFSGNLKQTSLLEAAQFLELGNHEGILHIYCGRRKGYISFKNGKVIDAFYRETTGKPAVLMMLDLDDGDFYFEQKTINQPRIMNESIINIAFEWDEHKQLPTSENSQTP
ncbi:MAG: DUF4388 domain-containing protein [Chitinivibrionales bacterium]|nr:DUF4388 domain-containing protein [Chitinivibrionales bacterium]